MLFKVPPELYFRKLKVLIAITLVHYMPRSGVAVAIIELRVSHITQQLSLLVSRRNSDCMDEYHEFIVCS